MKFRRKTSEIEAIRLIETSRRPAKFADIVERNTDEVASFAGVRAWREMTVPNGLPEGRTILVLNPPETADRPGQSRISIEVGEWLVKTPEGEFLVYEHAIFSTLFEPI